MTCQSHVMHFGDILTLLLFLFSLKRSNWGKVGDAWTRTLLCRPNWARTQQSSCLSLPSSTRSNRNLNILCMHGQENLQEFEEFFREPLFSYFLFCLILNARRARPPPALLLSVRLLLQPRAAKLLKLWHCTFGSICLENRPKTPRR